MAAETSRPGHVLAILVFKSEHPFYFYVSTYFYLGSGRESIVKSCANAAAVILTIASAAFSSSLPNLLVNLYTRVYQMLGLEGAYLLTEHRSGQNDFDPDKAYMTGTTELTNEVRVDLKHESESSKKATWCSWRSTLKSTIDSKKLRCIHSKALTISYFFEVFFSM